MLPNYLYGVGKPIINKVTLEGEWKTVSILSGNKLAGGNPERGRVDNNFYATDPKANVNDQQKLSDIVDDALSELNAINSNGDLDYDAYVELHNIISNIYNRFIYER